jgi:hypothetical protein
MKEAAHQPQQDPVWIQSNHLQLARRGPFLCRVEPTQRLADFVALYPGAPPRHDGTPMQWPASRSVGRQEDMGRGHLRLDLDSDNDVCIEVWNGERSASVEFCNPGGGGGGRSSRTRKALIELMRAIEADNLESPAVAWPPAA